MVTRWELLRWTATSKTNEVITQVGIQPGWAVLRCVNTSGELQVEGGRSRFQLFVAEANGTRLGNCM